MPEFSASQQINPDFNSDFNQAALQGVQRQTEVGGLNALQGVNLNDPQSVSNAMGNLIKTGNIDKASALANYNWTQGLRANAPNFISQLSSALGGQDQGQPTQPQASQSQGQDQTPDVKANATHAAETMNTAIQELSNLKNVPTDGLAREQAFDKVAGDLQTRGVPKEAIQAVRDHIFGKGDTDIPDAATQNKQIDSLIDNFKGHADNFGTVAGGGNIQTPTTVQPGPHGAWYTNLVNSPNYPSLGMYAGLYKSAGMDFTPAFEAARQLAAPYITEAAKTANIGQQTKETEANKLPFEVAQKVIDNHFATSKEPITLYPPGSTQGQTVSNAQWQAHPDVYAGWSTAAEPGAVKASEARGTLAGEYGSSITKPNAANLDQEQTNLTNASQKANDRLNSPQYDDTALTAKQIIGLGNSIGTGVYTKDLSDLAQKFAPLLPQSHLAQYATNSTLLSQDLSKAMKAQFAGSALPRIASEFNTITKAVPSNTSPQDTVKLYGALMLAKNNMEQDADRHLTQYQQNPTNGRSQTAAVGEFDKNRPDLLAYALPELQKMTINGKPAVEVRKFSDGTMRGMFLPGVKNATQFYIGRSQ